MLFLTPTLGSEEFKVLERIGELREALGYATTQKRRWVGFLRRTSFARAIRGSNSIEGYNVSVQDALAAADGEEPFAADPSAWVAVQGYRNALTYVLQLTDDPHFQYHESLIKSLHFMMLSYDLTKNPGRWRPGTIFVRSDERGEIVYEGPDAEVVPGLLSELVAALKSVESSVPVMVAAAMAHLNLVMIHPFSDGNGRMARGLQTLMLAREKILHPQLCSIEEYLGQNTSDYYRLLADVGQGRWSPQNNARPWIRFCLTAHYRQATTLMRRQKTMARLWDEIEEEVHKRKLHERMVMALGEAALGFPIRNARYRASAEVSDIVATRDLKELVAAQLLIAKGERRGRWYQASAHLTALAQKFAQDGAGPIPDPFDLVGQTTLF